MKSSHLSLSFSLWSILLCSSYLPANAQLNKNQPLANAGESHNSDLVSQDIQENLSFESNFLDKHHLTQNSVSTKGFGPQDKGLMANHSELSHKNASSNISIELSEKILTASQRTSNSLGNLKIKVPHAIKTDVPLSLPIASTKDTVINSEDSQSKAPKSEDIKQIQSDKTEDNQSLIGLENSNTINDIQPFLLDTDSQSLQASQVSFPPGQPANNTTSVVTSQAEEDEDKPIKPITTRIELYYFRDYDNLEEILEDLNIIGDGDGGGEVELIKQSGNRDTIFLNGPKEKIDEARRIIAALDIPRPGIDLQVWGILISSNDSDDLAQAMVEVNKEINRTQKLIKESVGFIYQYVQDLPAQKCSDNTSYEQNFACLVEELGYRNALSKNRPLSLSDAFIHLVAAENSKNKLTANLANQLYSFMKNDKRKRYKYFLKDLEKKQDGIPFERFFSGRGLSFNCPSDKKISNPNCKWEENGNAADNFALASRSSLLDFGFQYAQFIGRPNTFNPYYFQQSTDEMNSGVRYTFNSLNKDIEDFFILPTLRRIQKIVGKFGDVQYAQVGRTSLAGLSGVPMSVKTEIESVYESSPPLTLIDLLSRTNEVRSQLPPGIVPPSGQPLVAPGPIPIETIVSVLGALGQDRRVWQKLSLGDELSLTPKILRNNTSVELTFDMKVSSPDALNSHANNTEEEGGPAFPPVSRISSQHVQTTIYADAIDLFAFSTFSNQSTRSGGRGYIPLLGPIWRGIFGDIPFIGKLFSWRKAPKNVRHESILMTNSYITPTAMGLAQLYPIKSGNLGDTCKVINLKERIEEYTGNTVYISKDIKKECETRKSSY